MTRETLEKKAKRSRSSWL